VEKNKGIFSRELLRKYMAKLVYKWENKRYDRKYWKRIEEN